MKKIIYCLIFLLPLLGKADVQKILDITSESDADLLSTMSIDVDNLLSITSLIYAPDASKNELKTFPVQKLLKDRLILRAEKGVEVVSIMLKKNNETSFDVNVHYLYKFKLINRTYKDKKLNVSFSTPDNRYLVQDNETKKFISRLHFVTHYNEKGKEVGIEKIETL